jgi:hypothetical protein
MSQKLADSRLAKLAERAAPSGFLARVREVLSAPWTVRAAVWFLFSSSSCCLYFCLAGIGLPSAHSRGPAQLTGPASSSENLPSLTTADFYRPHAPGSAPVKVSVPHARPETTYNIKYFPRERRRVHSPLWNVGAVTTTQFVVGQPAGPLSESAALPGVRSACQEWHTGKSGARMVPLLDDENNGATRPALAAPRRAERPTTRRIHVRVCSCCFCH